MVQPMAIIHRTFRAGWLTVAITSVLMTAWGAGAWPRGSHWNFQKFLCSELVERGAVLAISVWISGCVWILVSSDARNRWWVWVVTGICFGVSVLAPGLLGRM